MTDYEDLSIRDLQAEASERKLPTSRVKAELVERLEEHDKQVNGDETDEQTVSATVRALDYQVWQDKNGRVRVAYLYNGRITDKDHADFLRRTAALARENGYTPVGDAERVLAQGARTVYAVRVKDEDAV